MAHIIGRDILYFLSSFPNAIEVLKELDERGHEIYYITSRPKEHGERTKEWLKSQGFPVKDEWFFYGMQDNEKVQVIKKLKLDYYFDDKPEVLNTLLHEVKTKVVVRDQSYNRYLKFPRILDWGNIKKVIKEL